MRVVTRHWFALTLVAAAWVMSATLYRSLSATIAIHWNARGVVDGWAPKWEGAFMVPCLAVILFAFLILLERWSRNEEIAGAQLSPFFYPTLVAAVAALCFYVNASVLFAGLGLKLGMTSHAVLGAGLVLAVLGSTLGTSPQAPAPALRIAGWILVVSGMVTVVAEILVRVGEAA